MGLIGFIGVILSMPHCTRNPWLLVASLRRSAKRLAADGQDAGVPAGADRFQSLPPEQGLERLNSASLPQSNVTAIQQNQLGTGMLLQAPGPTMRRVTVFVAVVALHLLAALLLLSMGNTRTGVRSQASASLTILHFPAAPQPPDRRKIEASNDFSVPRTLEPHALAPPHLPLPSNMTALPPNDSITPNIDWNKEAEGVMQRQLDESEAERRRRNLAGPSSSQLEWARKHAPQTNEHHQLGDTQSFEGGEVITWENDRCYWTTRGITTVGMPNTQRVCKDRPQPVTDLFKDLRKKREDPGE